MPTVQAKTTNKDSESSKRMPYELFKSAVCHRVKSLGDLEFVKDTLLDGTVDRYYERGWYIETLYLVAMVDYLCRINGISQYTGYAPYRSVKLSREIFSDGTLLLDSFNGSDKAKEDARRNAIPEFKRHNIMEAEIRDVV